MTDEQSVELARACTGHPLALHIAAAHLKSRPRVDADRFTADISHPGRTGCVP
ncbi:hypothetical protein [Streptomyces sp. KL116D]|uniref:hypothetical protein n=1 Tax=Streptomyces sp. KL116D TaxID=3045152 RepID=UPI003557BE89